MRKFAAAAMIVAIALLTGCGGDSHESVMEDGMSSLKELVSVLEGVKDEATAKAAAPKIEAIGKRMEEIKKRQEALPKMDDKQKAALEEKYKKDIEEIAPKLFAAAFNPEVNKHLKDSMDKLKNAMPK